MNRQLTNFQLAVLNLHENIDRSAELEENEEVANELYKLSCVVRIVLIQSLMGTFDLFHQLSHQSHNIVVDNTPDLGALHFAEEVIDELLGQEEHTNEVVDLAGLFKQAGFDPPKDRPSE